MVASSVSERFSGRMPSALKRDRSVAYAGSMDGRWLSLCSAVSYRARLAWCVAKLLTKISTVESDRQWRSGIVGGCGMYDLCE